jgi:hypothetical protein
VGWGKGVFKKKLINCPKIPNKNSLGKKPKKKKNKIPSRMSNYSTSLRFTIDYGLTKDGLLVKIICVSLT